MLESPNHSEQYKYDEKSIEKIVLKAIEMPQFQSAVQAAQNKVEAIKVVRGLLSQYFPEIASMPEGVKKELVENENAPTSETMTLRGNPFGGRPLTNDFLIAKNIVDLLWEK